MCGLPIDRGSRCATHLDRGLANAAWRRASKRQRSLNPLCADCEAEGRVVPATEAHHIVSRASGGAVLTPLLLSLCHSHHSRRTARGE
jgi:dihydrodipicolinate synthase/N-acetylneuraminate lyase